MLSEQENASCLDSSLVFADTTQSVGLAAMYAPVANQLEGHAFHPLSLPCDASYPTAARPLPHLAHTMHRA